MRASWACLRLLLVGISALFISEREVHGRSAIAADPCAAVRLPHSGGGRIDQEIIGLQRALARDPVPISQLERLGWAFVAKARASQDPGYYKLAELCALCIETRTAESPESLLLRGHVLHSQHRFAEAEVLARRLVEKRGRWFDRALLGDVLMEQGKLGAAIIEYQALADERPGPQAYSRAAHVRWLRGDLLGARELMRMAAMSAGDAEAAAWSHTRLALYELQLGNLSRSLGHTEAALQLHDAYAPALLARGRALLAAGDVAAALAALRRAAERIPQPEYQWALLEGLEAAGRRDEARRVGDELMRLGAANDPRTFALYLATRGEAVERAVRLAELELRSRSDVFTHDALAWALAAAGQMIGAHEHMRLALAEGTSDARLFLHAAVIEARFGHRAESEHWCRRAAAMGQLLFPTELRLLAPLCAEAGAKENEGGRDEQRAGRGGAESRVRDDAG